MKEEGAKQAILLQNVLLDVVAYWFLCIFLHFLRSESIRRFSVSQQQRTEQVALITGANKGIGFAAARQLGVQGITILVGSRNLRQGEQAASVLQEQGVKAQALEIDVTDQKTIDVAVEKVFHDFGKLDILVNNAGISVERVPPSQSQMENLRKTFDTNFFGSVAVTKAFLPLIQQAEAGRIVNVSSGLGSMTTMSDPTNEYYAYNSLGYTASKVALNALTMTLAKELSLTAIKVNSADPGFTATDLNNFRGTQTVEEATEVIIRLATLPPEGPTGAFFDKDRALPW
jgi:NAD(P)-dependent dehydrogenase (short-subunit alcohol dehydrogenase family)